MAQCGIGVVHPLSPRVSFELKITECVSLSAPCKEKTYVPEEPVVGGSRWRVWSVGRKLFQQTLEARGQHFAGFGGRDQTFEKAEIDVDGELAIADVNCAGDGCAHQAQRTHFRNEGKCKMVSAPASGLLNQFDRHRAGVRKEVVERAVNGLLDLFFAAAVGDGDLHGTRKYLRAARAEIRVVGYLPRQATI